MSGEKIIFGIPPLNHVTLAMDEVKSMENIGYRCYTSIYGNNASSAGKLNRITATIRNAFKLKSKLKNVHPHFLYLNSRFEPIGSLRDYLTLSTLKIFNRKSPRIIIKSHGSDLSILWSNKFIYKKIVLPYLTKNVDAWIFLSNEEKRIIEKHNPVMATRVHVLPNIIISERCESSNDFRMKYNLPADKFICLFVGRLVEVKGVFDILESISYLQSPGNFHFLFVGNGDDESRLKSNAETLNSKSAIQFTGFITDAECDQFFTTADALIYPTYDTEGFCMALFKSVACGIPVITTRLRAAKDYLSEPENVLWVKEKDPEGIANALERIYTDNALKQSMIRNNKLVGKKFLPEEVAQKMDEIFSKWPS